MRKKLIALLLTGWVALVAGEGLTHARWILDPFFKAIQLQQGWTMFSSSPRFEDVDMSLLIDGHRYHPALPGLREAPKTTKYKTLLLLSSSPATRYSKAYRAAVCRNMRARQMGANSFSIEISKKLIGQDWTTETLGPYVCN
jgi:hypothetical protein